jgi:hypothetical protein
VVGRTDLAEVDGVECANPDAAPDARVYTRTFHNPQKKIYTATQYETAMDTHLRGKNVIVLGMNGFSRLTSQQCAASGVLPGEYEIACAIFLKAMVLHMQDAFPLADVRLTHGSSWMGVDRVIQEVAFALNRPQMGFTCLDFLWYAPDNDVPLHVSRQQTQYSEAFAKSSDVLIAANGRAQAYEMDYLGVLKFGKHFMPINILKLISRTGGPPAVNAEGKIEDAVAYFEQRMHSVNVIFGGPGAGRDPWQSAVNAAREIVTDVCRRVLPPEIRLTIK